MDALLVLIYKKGDLTICGNWQQLAWGQFVGCNGKAVCKGDPKKADSGGGGYLA